MRLGDIELSITPATRTAMSVLTRYASPAMRNHAIRSGLWAAAFAQITHLAHDPELLQVAALLHDLSLEAPFDSHRLPFEQASGHVAIVFAAGAGWPPARADRLALAIEQHMADDVDGLEPEGYLLQRATSLDISGRDVAEIPTDLVAEVVATVPRLNLVEEFADRFEDQARRKKSSPAAAAIRSGLLTRMAANPLERLGSAHE